MYTTTEVIAQVVLTGDLLDGPRSGLTYKCLGLQHHQGLRGRILQSKEDINFT